MLPTERTSRLLVAGIQQVRFRGLQKSAVGGLKQLYEIAGRICQQDL
jgi:hypothetical protein